MCCQTCQRNGEMPDFIHVNHDHPGLKQFYGTQDEIEPVLGIVAWGHPSLA
jgi:hypothetical protein